MSSSTMAHDIAGAAKRSKRAASLPPEIVDEILLLLPARSVLRFRAVCRQWAAHLSSPAFTDAYAEARRISKLVVFAASPGRRSTAVYSCSSRSPADQLFTVDNLRTDFLLLSSRPSHGLMLFSDTRTTSGGYWVCNPSTGECRALPRQRHRGLTNSSAGLVLDDQTQECKVVHLFSKKLIGPMCEVYTLGDPSRQWRPPTSGLESFEANERNVTRALQTQQEVTKVPPVSVDGCLHWLIYPTDVDGVPLGHGRVAILRFSATGETFDFITAPYADIWEDDVWLEEHSPAVPFHLAELHGSLCMVHDLRQRQRGGSLDVWLRRYNNGEWSLDYRIPAAPLLARGVHSPRFITVLGCYGGKKGDGRLLVATSEHKVYAYAPETGGVEMVFSVEETDIGLQKQAAAGLWLGMYEDSLVRIGGRCHRQEQVSSAVREVLLRLPLESIAQSMLVCKEWCMLIESQSFVARQLAMKGATRISMATNGRARRAFFGFAPLESWLRQGLASSLVSGKIICSKPCHGLNLVSTGSDDYLCNPCTGIIQCLGIRGRSRFSPCYANRQSGRRHAFTVGRSIGFGFDHTTGEHVAVEIGHLCGTLACMLKTSESRAWTCVGTPPVPVTDMPPAHVDGTLYWVGETARVIIVAFDIPTRAFDILPCEQPCTNNNNDHQDLLLVELNKKLSLIIMNREAEEMEIWTMHNKQDAWVNAHRICLRGHPDFSLKTTMVVPLEINGEDGRIMLNTGRALGYYNTKTGALHTIYSLDHLQFPPSNLAFPMLCQESLAPVQNDEELPLDPVAPPLVGSHIGRPTSCEHPDHADVEDEGTTLRPIFHKCQKTGCQGNGEIYSNCCKRVICRECVRRCLGHYAGVHVPLNNLYASVIEGIRMEHPFVPDPDYYCYYYSAIDNGDVVRHVFVSIKDLVQEKVPCHLTECAYRMDRHGAVRETWVRRYLKVDFGRAPLPLA
ncbi:hypothetical protein ACP70R_000934 [Stipagrostis hirtigluma subsp. patula]